MSRPHKIIGTKETALDESTSARYAIKPNTFFVSPKRNEKEMAWKVSLPVVIPHVSRNGYIIMSFVVLLSGNRLPGKAWEAPFAGNGVRKPFPPDPPACPGP